MVRVSINFKNKSAVSFKCEKNNVEMVIEIMLRELKYTKDCIDKIKVTAIED